MSVLRSSLLLLMSIAGMHFLAVEADACSCGGENPPCSEYWRTDAVFKVTVDSELRAEDVYNGDPSDSSFQGRLCIASIENTSDSWDDCARELSKWDLRRP